MAGYAAALEAGHELGDYWVQTDHQAATKGLPGMTGSIACAKHVLSYTATQAVCVIGAALATGAKPRWGRVALGLAVSAVTHYAADRREHGLMYPLARAMPGKAKFLELGVPRSGTYTIANRNGPLISINTEYDDNPSLGTGAWALDQAWHKAFGVFLPAIIMAGRSDA
jgi:hypothetical protein